MVMPSSPLALDVPMRCRAADSSGSVAGRGLKAPLQTRGGRGWSVSPVSAAARLSATAEPTVAKCWFRRLYQPAGRTAAVSWGLGPAFLDSTR